MENKFSKSVSGGTRVYYFDVRTDKNNNDYLTITEMNPHYKDRRACINIYPEHLESFMAGLENAAANVNKR